MGMYGLLKLHHAHNNWCARQGYAEVCAFAVEVGRADLVDLRPFNEPWGWRRLDKLSEKILAKLGTDWHGAQDWIKSVGGTPL